jgi:hypothetical protein
VGTPFEFNYSQHGPTKAPVNKNKNTSTTNLYTLFFLLFLLDYNSITHTKTPKPTELSFFFLPVRKQSVIFLRAPYKNKLARLNIVNLEYTLVISIKYTYKLFSSVKSNKNLTLTINQLGGYNFGTAKLKHARTKIKSQIFMKNNFMFLNYL